MKKILFLLLNVSLLLGQSRIDSLNNLVKDKPDAEKFKYLSALCWENRYNNSILAFDAGSVALDIAKKIKNKSFEANILNRIGVIFRWMNNADASMNYAGKALDAAKEAKDSVELGYAENNIGGTYQMKSFNALAIEHILTALRIFQKINFDQGIAHCSISLGNIFQVQQNYDKALEHYNRALALRIKMKDKSGEASALNAIASIYLAQKKTDLAHETYKRTETLTASINDKTTNASAYGGLSKTAFEEKDYMSALQYAQKALNIVQEVKNVPSEINSLIHIAVVQSYMKRFNEAEMNLGQADILARNSKNDLQTLNLYKARSIFYELKGDSKSSLYFSKLSSDMKDTIAKHENTARGNEMEAVNEYLRTKNDIALLQKSIEFKEQQKTYLIIIIILTVLTFFVVYWRYRAKKAANEKLHELNAMKDLFFGIIAHDLKNPFLSILGATDLLLKEINTMPKEDIKAIVEMIDNSGKWTYKLLENLLYWSLSQTGQIRFNPEAIKMTVLIQETIALNSNIANSKNIKLNSVIHDEVEALCDKEMIRLVLRNLVSNGIKYTQDGGEVNIILNKKNNFIQISVEDNGIGMSKDIIDNLSKIGAHDSTPGTRGEKGTGLGLILCKDFVERNKGTFTIESNEGKGSRFVFTLPEMN